MNKDTITRLARQAEGEEQHHGMWRMHVEDLERFAALVAAAEREECAKMAEAFHRHGYDFTGDLELHEAIRSRK